jgi:hypothetical protein
MQTVAITSGPRTIPARIIKCSSAISLLERKRRRVKVDILIPLTPRLWIPKVLSEDTWLIKDIPVMPLFDLLVMKMQGWMERSQGLALFGLPSQSGGSWPLHVDLPPGSSKHAAGRQSFRCSVFLRMRPAHRHSPTALPHLDHRRHLHCTLDNLAQPTTCFTLSPCHNPRCFCSCLAFLYP